jgi:hypothetical protein
MPGQPTEALNLRINPELKRRVEAEARQAGQSINATASGLLAIALDPGADADLLNKVLAALADFNATLAPEQQQNLSDVLDHHGVVVEIEGVIEGTLESAEEPARA